MRPEDAHATTTGAGSRVTIMEVCGGQTDTSVKYGIDHILPAEVELVHGPGCPVC
jgi:hydrogenase expression/formation protein HypD